MESVRLKHGYGLMRDALLAAFKRGDVELARTEGMTFSDKSELAIK